jgi:hypothetical protein
MQRWIKQANARGRAIKGPENSLKVAALKRQQLGQRRSARNFGARQNHFTHGVNAMAVKEHVLGAAQANTFGTES